MITGKLDKSPGKLLEKPKNCGIKMRQLFPQPISIKLEADPEAINRGKRQIPI